MSNIETVLQRLGLKPGAVAAVIASAETAPPLTADQSMRISMLFRSASGCNRN